MLQEIILMLYLNLFLITQDKIMRNLNFWIKASNYSIIVCSIVLIAKMFLRKYIENIIVPILLLGGIAFLVFAISELMKFILKRRQ